MPRALRCRLEEELARRREEGPSAPVFRSRRGWLSDRRARELLLQCCRLAQLPPLSLHQLRHAACARWLRAGVPLLLISPALGHPRPSTIPDRHASVTALDLERSLALDPLAPALAEGRGERAQKKTDEGAPPTPCAAEG